MGERVQGPPGRRRLLLGKQVAQYLDALDVAAHSIIGPDNLARLTARAEQIVPGVTARDAWPALHHQLIMTGLDGTNPYNTLRRAADRQDLADADDPAAVLAWRIQPERPHDGSTVPALPAVPKSLEADDYWHRYFDRRHELIDRHAAALRSQVAQWTPSIAPTWADPLVERDRDLAADLAVWGAGHNIPDTDLRPSGPRRTDYAGWKAQRDLDRRVETLLGSADSATGRWHDWATAVDPRITTDPAWPQAAASLETAARAGVSRPVLDHLAREHPLPDEQPAAALHWRIVATTNTVTDDTSRLPSSPPRHPHASTRARREAGHPHSAADDRLRTSIRIRTQDSARQGQMTGRTTRRRGADPVGFRFSPRDARSGTIFGTSPEECIMAITASEARKNLFPLIEQVNDDRTAVEITSKRGDAVLMSRADYDALEETAHLLRSPANARRLLESLAQAQRGEREEHQLER